ncbi:Fe-S-containing hydro-lyase [Brassicibacter mesophilus]|uniref:Fe-S-containing hydro-lyase n=1 Tax=Brassicibacter mesophilus TaxID=745119 RepID=UPI003D2251AF
MNDVFINTPLNEATVKKLNAGDRVYITGTVYTARDAAHKRMIEELDSGKGMPFDIKDAIIYYVGPCPPKPGDIIGSAGPTTSYRMDSYTPKLLNQGLKGMIGKGLRSKEVIESMVKNKAVYFTAIGGAGALIANCVKDTEIIAYSDLGTEAIRRLYVENLPVIVTIDSSGNNLYNIENQKYKK